MLHKNWSLRLYTDEGNRELMSRHFPTFLSLYDGYDTTIRRVDAVRLFYLYLYGGVYADLDVMCLRPFESLPLTPGEAAFGYQGLGYTNSLMLKKCCEDHEAKCTNGSCVHRGTDQVPNAFMVAPPRHPLIAQLILGLQRAASTNFKGKLGHPLAATGPVYLSSGIQHWVSGLGRGHVVVHRPPRIFSGGYVGTSFHRATHPCSFEFPLARRREVEERKCGETSKERSAMECRHVRAWYNMSEADSARLAVGAAADPGELTCARRLPTAITISFWTASWLDQYQNESARVAHG